MGLVEHAEWMEAEHLPWVKGRVTMKHAIWGGTDVSIHVALHSK